MSVLNPHLLWLLAVVPLVWWIAQRRATRGTAVIPHLPVLESILTARDTSPAAPPWRAVALAAGCACAVLAAADLRRNEPAPRRLLVLWWGLPGAGGETAREVWRSRLPEDDVHLLTAGPAGMRTDDPAMPPELDGRRADPAPSLADLQAVAGPGAVVLTRAQRESSGPIVCRAFRCTPAAEGVAMFVHWTPAGDAPVVPFVERHDGDGTWEPVWEGAPIPAGAPLAAEGLLSLRPGRHTLRARFRHADSEVHFGTTITQVVVPEPRAALVVAGAPRLPIERAVVAGLAAMPDLIRSAERVTPDELAPALAARPGALLVGIGVAPTLAPERDWICIQPPAGDPLLPLQASEGTSLGVAQRFNGAHVISRGLSAAGIEFDHLPRLMGAGLLDGHSVHYEALLLTDQGVAAVAGKPTGASRLVAVLGDATRAFAEYPTWPRFLRRSAAWIAAGRAQAATELQRAGSARTERPEAVAGRVALPVWRGQTRGAVRWPEGVHRTGEASTLVLEPDAYRPAAPLGVDPGEPPPRERRPVPGPPASWPVMLAALLLIAAVAPLPGAAASRA